MTTLGPYLKAVVSFSSVTSVTDCVIFLRKQEDQQPPTSTRKHHPVIAHVMNMFNF